MSVRTPEVLTPDGDGDEQRGIEQAELHANYSNPDGSLRTTESRGPVRESVDSPVRGVKAIYFDPDYNGSYDRVGKDGGRQEQKAQRAGFDDLPRSWMSGMAIEATVYAGVRARRRRAARQSGYAALRVMPGGRFSPPVM
jgi:hypothetical protein